MTIQRSQPLLEGKTAGYKKKKRLYEVYRADEEFLYGTIFTISEDGRMCAQWDRKGKIVFPNDRIPGLYDIPPADLAKLESGVVG